MERLLDAVVALVCRLPLDKVQAIANKIRGTDASRAVSVLSGVMGAPKTVGIVDQMVAAWRATSVSSDELASMLLAASHTFTGLANRQSTELVWTGPTTPFVAARRTEQALLQVINSAEQDLFITSYVAYDVNSIVKALNAAIDRGVVISLLLESSQEQGGSISIDAIGKMREQVPAAKLYAWRDKSEPFSGGRVHAKVAVADGKMCFITSANLTGHAMDKNMEAGVLISGGNVAGLLKDHLQSLVDTNVVSRF